MQIAEVRMPFTHCALLLQYACTLLALLQMKLSMYRQYETFIL